jgi:DNA invertase Pin-like site-specific DNA recombinase
MSKAYGYVRASTLVQKTSPEVQKTEIELYYNYKLAPKGVPWGGFFEDPATTSKIPLRQRPAGSKLSLALEAGDHVLFAAFDRAFRSAREAHEVLEHWRAQGVFMHFLGLDIDTSTATGRLLYGMVAAMAQWERERVSERTTEALRWRKSQGLRYNKSMPWGWQATGPKGARKLVPDEHVRECGRRFAEFIARGYSLTQIAAWCDEHGVKQRSGKPWIKTSIRAAAIKWEALHAADLQAQAQGRELRPYEGHVSAGSGRR